MADFPATFLVLLVLLVVLVLVMALVVARSAGFRGPGALDPPSGPRAHGGGPPKTGARGCYPPGLVTELLAVARQGKGYAPPTEKERQGFCAAAARLSAKHQVEVPSRALESMHQQERSLRARNRTSNPQSWHAKLRADRRRGLSVVESAARHDLPPMFVLKALGLKGGAGVPCEGEALDAALADAGSALHQRKTRARADGYEAVVGAELDRLGLPHWTEEDLRLDGEVLTPDFLLKEPAELRGRSVAWVDAKNYAYYGNRLTLPGLKKQARKYTAAFGPGAMVFAGGHACAAPPLGALVLGPDWARGLTTLPPRCRGTSSPP